MTTRTGGCLCGQVRYRVGGEPQVLCLCHCSLCRRSVGASPVAWATFARQGFEFSGPVGWYESSPGTRRGFCQSCGCSLFFDTQRLPQEIDVTLVSLDQAAEFAPDRHLFVPDALPWEQTDPGLARHEADANSPLFRPF